MIHKARLEHAHRLLHGDMAITDVALHCGYTDHSAFSRQFKALTGFTRASTASNCMARTAPVPPHPAEAQGRSAHALVQLVFLGKMQLQNGVQAVQGALQFL
jgi:AraC-like DNA-binding protein